MIQDDGIVSTGAGTHSLHPLQVTAKSQKRAGGSPNIGPSIGEEKAKCPVRYRCNLYPSLIRTIPAEQRSTENRMNHRWHTGILISCIAAAAVIQAIEQALSQSPHLAAKFPDLGWLNYVPLALLSIAALLGIGLLIRKWNRSEATGQAQVVNSTVERSLSRLKIISAYYGADGGPDRDVAEEYLQPKIRGDSLVGFVGADLFGAYQPLIGPKRLKIRYSFDGEEATVVRRDQEMLVLPEDRFLKGQLEECQRQSKLNQNQESKAQLAMFLPVQIEAFQLAKDLRDFFAGLGPRPAFNKALQDGTREGIERALSDLHAREKPWDDKLLHGYSLRFAERVARMRHLLGEEGLSSEVFENIENLGITNVTTIPSLAREIERSAVELHYTNFRLPSKM